MTTLMSVAVDPTATQATTINEILVIDSDAAIARVLVDQFLQDGFAAVHGQSAHHARLLARQRRPDAVVLGMLPGSRGPLDLLGEIRCAGDQSCWESSLPVLMLSRHTGEIDMLRAFAGGADDFIARPARYTELLARLRALLRRARVAEPARARIRVGSLQVDTVSHTVSVAGRRIKLRRQEYELLVHLAAEPTRVFTKTELLYSVWGFESTCAIRTVDSHACRLRRKLNVLGGHWVVNVWGVGYRLT